MTDAILRARGLRKHYGPQEVLRGLDLDLARGQVTVVLGENGAGKSTLLRVLAGDLRADNGSIAVDGQSLADHPEAARARLIYVAQHPPLAPLLTLREHADALCAFRGLDASKAAPELERLATALRLERVMDKPVRALSGGTAHKAALVLAFLADVPLMLLDEPHAGLDVRSALALRELIVERRQRGTALLLASHLAEATLAVADRALVLRAGTVALDLDAQALQGFAGDARAFEHAVLAAMVGA